MTSKFTREELLNIIETDHVQCGEASALARMALAAMDSSESIELPLDYLQGHKDGLEWASQLAEANYPETGDWLYDDPIELAKAIRKGPDMPPAQPAPEYPEVLPCPVLLEPGMRFGKGVKTRLVLDAIQRRAEHYAELEAMTPEERTEYDAGIEAFKAMLPQPAPVVNYVTLGDSPYDVPCSMPSNLRELIAEEIGILFSDDDAQSVWNVCRHAAMLERQLVDRVDEKSLTSINPAPDLVSLQKKAESIIGNYPGIPDGYVMVPKEMTDEIGEAIAMQANCCGGIALDIYDAMIAAAPQEVKGE